MENFFTQIRNTASKFKTNKIAIIGKGSSINEINIKHLAEEFILININDSERIIPGHYAILHRPWTHQSVKENGFKCINYISDIETDNAKFITVDYKPDSFDSIENSIDIIESPTFYITDFLFVPAIRLAIELSKIYKKKMEVYFLGFDFESIPNNNQQTTYQLNTDDEIFKKVFLKKQEEYFIYIKKYCEKNIKNISILHVGKRTYSELDIQSFNNIIKKPSTAKKNVNVPEGFNLTLYENLILKIKEGHTIIVAEFTNNHLGDKARLKEMIRLSKEAGADIIKVQKRDVLSFYTEEELNREYNSVFGKTLKDYRVGVELTNELFEIIETECHKHQIPWFASILDYNSFKFIERYNCPILKIPSTISNHKNYIKQFANEYKGDVVVSTGFTDTSYEDFIINIFCASKRRLWLLQCTSSYPTPFDACQIAIVRHYDKINHANNLIYAGYSSHDIGSLGSMMAVAAGAKMIEKHVKLGDVEWVHFDGVALNLQNEEFHKFVQDIRKAEMMCGGETKKIHSSEHHKYNPNNNHN